MLYQVKQARHKMSHVVSFHIYETSRIDDSQKPKIRLVVAKTTYRGKIGSDHIMAPGFPSRLMKMFWNYIELRAAQQCKFTICPRIAHFIKIVRMANFLLYELYHNSCKYQEKKQNGGKWVSLNVSKYLQKPNSIYFFPSTLHSSC